jgi:hypothetical protein
MMGSTGAANMRSRISSVDATASLQRSKPTPSISADLQVKINRKRRCYLTVSGPELPSSCRGALSYRFRRFLQKGHASESAPHLIACSAAVLQLRIQPGQRRSRVQCLPDASSTGCARMRGATASLRARPARCCRGSGARAGHTPMKLLKGSCRGAMGLGSPHGISRSG